LHVDHFEPLNESNKESKHLSCYAFTYFIWFFSTKLTGTKDILKYLSSLFKLLGNERVMSDRRSVFISCEFSDFLSERKVNHRLIAISAPWINGLAEKANRILKICLKKLINEHD